MHKGWLVVSKKEMTKIWKDDKFLTVTLAQILPQEILRYKNSEKDWYNCAVIWVEKKELKKTKWKKVSYNMVTEFPVDEEFVKNNEVGKNIDMKFMEWITNVDVVWYSKGKGYQWVMKIFHTKWWPKTHWSKFHRHVGSMWNRKPRRTLKWHPHAGHMWNARVTLKRIDILDVYNNDKEQIVVLKWSLPWCYNWLLKLIVN